MKFSVSSGVLSTRLQTISKVLGVKSTIAVLECFLFEVKENKLFVKASDSETQVETTIEIIEGATEGKVAILGKTLLEALRELPEQPITVSVDMSTSEVTIFYQNGKASFIGRNGDEYPIWKEMEGEIVNIELPANVVSTGVGNTLFATADDELRPVMNGVFFDVFADCVTFVASDSHKLVRYRNMTNTGIERASIILPKKTSAFLRNVLSKEENPVKISFDSQYARFVLENYCVSCRLIDGRYPNYNAVIPQNNIYKATIDRASFISALRRTAVFSSQANNLIILNLKKGMLEVSAQDIDFSTSAEEKIACSYDGIDMKIGFKSLLLIDTLTNMQSSEVVLELQDPSRAGLIVPSSQLEGEELIMLVMPMMLND